MLNIAIIPARAGSKRLPGKNIRILCGKPLIIWTIEAALQCGCYDKVIVSTDSEEIKTISESVGAYVPYLRKPELSTDTATTDDVVSDLVVWVEKNHGPVKTITILQPTSPLRSSTDITNAFKLMYEKKADAIVSVCELEHPLQFCNILPESLSLNNFLNSNDNKRAQELPTSYRLNGAIYLIDRKYVGNLKGIYSSGSFAYIMKKEASIDIDELVDFEFAEFLMRKKS